jgi:hypothetical protein
MMVEQCPGEKEGKEEHMRTLTLRTVASCLVVIAALGCSGIKVSTDYNREFDFRRLKTYEWMARLPQALRDPLIDTALLDMRVKEDVERELSVRGYDKVEGDPDFFVSYHFGTESQVDVSSCGYHYPMSPRCWGQEVETYTYTEGTLILDIVSADDLELIWRGYATGAINDIDNMDDTINQAVRKVLADFPPKD